MSQNFLYIIAIVFILQLNQISTQTVDFDRNYFGVVFRPYTKFHDNSDDYTIAEVEDMLQVISTRFTRVATLEMGSIGDHPWDKSLAEGFIPVAASNLNRRRGSLDIKVIVGAGEMEDDKLDTITMPEELKNALEASTVANSNFPGTVQGIALAGGEIKELDQVIELNDFLRDVWPNATKIGVKIGIQIDNCKKLTLSPEDEVLELIRLVGFIICFKEPRTFSNVTNDVAVLGDYFLDVRKYFESVNRNIQIIGQSRWPSADIMSKTYDASKSTQFWIQMEKWARQNKFYVDLLCAFDLSWSKDSTHANCGWWKRVKNDVCDESAFVEKINYEEQNKGEAFKEELSLAGMGSGTTVVVTALGIVGAFALLMLVGGYALFKKLTAVQNQLLTRADIADFKYGIKQELDKNATEGDALQAPYDKSYEIPKWKLLIEMSKTLGSGTFGCVYKGRVQGSEREVAFKTTQPNCSGNSLKSLLQEIKILIHVGRHQNVVSIIGANTEELGKGKIWIATELCEKGNLEKHLRERKAQLVENFGLKFQTNDATLRICADPQLFQTLLRWSYEIACGMEYISSKNVIHADLATRNVLLTANGVAKITDFGLSRRMYEYANYIKQNQEPLPWRWMALESLQEMNFSTKSDVWSYGVTLWEIFSLAEVPYPCLTWTVDFTNQLANGLRLPLPNYATQEIYGRIFECWNHFPNNRPTFTTLASYFCNLMCEVSYKENLPYTVYDNVPLLQF